MRLQTPRLCTFHLLPDLLDLGCIERVARQRAILHQRLDTCVVEFRVDHLMQTRPHFRSVAISNGLNEQVTQFAALNERHDKIQNIIFAAVVI